MPINITELMNLTDKSPIGIGATIDSMSGGLFGTTTLIAIYIITFILFSRFGARDAFGVASFIGCISAIFLRLMGWLGNDLFVFVSIALVVVGGLMLIYRGDD